MGRRNYTITPFLLGATQTVDAAYAIPIGEDGDLAIQCLIDNGTDGVAPTDTPAGSWQLWCSSDGQTYSRVSGADTELAKIAPAGNALVSAYAILEGVPGSSAKLVYVRTGGGATTRARLRVTV
jgi:hypothetical protein